MKKLLCAILAMALVILPVGGSMVAYAEDAEVPVTAFASSSVTATGTSGTVTWTLYDDGELNIAPTSGDEGKMYAITDYNDAPWYSYRESITSVTVTGTVHAGSTMNYMFANYESLTTVDLSGLDTSSVREMYNMFAGCSALTELDLSSFDTSSVEYMSYMFYGCSSLTALDLSSFNMSSVEYRVNMFGGCSSLQSIALGESWDWTDGNGNVITSEEEGLLPAAACWSKVESSENGTNTYDSSIGELTSKQLAAQWTSDYAGTWVRVNVADNTADDNNSSGGGSTSLQTQKITVKKSQLTKTIHTKKLKKKNQTFKLKASTSGNGKITYKKVKGNKKIKVSKAGKVTVKKGLKKGKTYKVKVKVTAAKTSTYKKATKTVTLKIKIK